MPLALTDTVAVIALGLLCWGLRVTFVLLVPADRLPAPIAQALQHLAPAALASICAVELTAVLHHADLRASVASTGVVALAAAVALWTRNMTWTVLAGVAAVLVVDLVLLAG